MRDIIEKAWENRELLKEESTQDCICLLYTSDAADERSSVDLGGRRIIKNKTKKKKREIKKKPYKNKNLRTQTYRTDVYIDC